MAKIKEITDALEMFAPLPLQEGYDNAGLQIGLTEAEVKGALLCLDVTEDILDEFNKKLLFCVWFVDIGHVLPLFFDEIF